MPGTDAKNSVIASYDALNENDIDAALEALAEDAEWHESEVLP
jgi:ketosteroid isomerase-like protein